MEPTKTGPYPIQRVIQKLVTFNLITRFNSRYLHKIDRTFWRISRGRISASSFLIGVPIILLQTTGAQSGKSRTSVLVGIPLGDKIALIASNWGQHRLPGWYYNLKANHQALVIRKGIQQAYLAREALGEEYAECWGIALWYYPGYATYAQHAGRPIPILVLERE